MVEPLVVLLVALMAAEKAVVRDDVEVVDSAEYSVEFSALTLVV